MSTSELLRKGELQTDLYMRSPSTGRVSKERQLTMRKDGWDHRHHVTHSSSNMAWHHTQREFFSRFVEPRSKRVLPQRPFGITQHHYPHRHHASFFGADDGPTSAEVLLGSDHHLPVPPPPSEALKQLLPLRGSLGRGSSESRRERLGAESIPIAG